MNSSSIPPRPVSEAGEVFSNRFLFSSSERQTRVTAKGCIALDEELWVIYGC